MRFTSVLFHFILLSLCSLLPATVRGEVTDFNLPAQPLADALLAFSKQAKVEVLFSFEEMRKLTSTPVIGRYEPEDALNRLLRETGFVARRNAYGKFVVTPSRPAAGTIKGRLLTPDGSGAEGVRIVLPQARQSTKTDKYGDFSFGSVPSGLYHLQAGGGHYQPVQVDNLRVKAGEVLTVETQTLQPNELLTKLDPFVVVGESYWRRTGSDPAATLPRQAAGNLDLPRSEDGALPYTIYTRDRIARSGVVDVNEFLQREVLDSAPAIRSAEQDPTKSSYISGSSNLRLRGYEADETVILVNGRRLPETLSEKTGWLGSPDVNFIPLSLIERVEVLPLSASALYSGNAVGGVINIVLRPDVATTEVNATYGNAAGKFDAPQASLSLQHGESLLGGALRLRLSATFSGVTPPTESELGYLQARIKAAPAQEDDRLYRATPNIRSVSGGPLFGPATSSVTSVAPGADGSGGLAAFAYRPGVRSLDLFDSPGGLASSPNSLDYSYGRRQRRSSWFASAVYDVFPWLQIGLDGTYVYTVANRGYNVFTADLNLRADAPLNPFRQDLIATLNETPVQLGENYSEAHLTSTATVLSLLFKLPAEWRVALDTQYARNLTDYRGFTGVDPTRWQQLVDQGRYNPLRDTQTHGPPTEFYDQVLVYYGGRGRFLTLSDYDTLDAAVRVSNQSLSLPTGRGTVNFGADYRRTHLADFNFIQRYGDGTFFGTPQAFTGRSLERFSAFGELQAPLLPARRLPRWLRSLEADLAVRYIAADSSRETYWAPTLAMKADFAGGFAARGSVSTSSRYPTPHMSKQVVVPSGGGGGADYVAIYDPLRHQSYNVPAALPFDFGVSPESAITQTAGLVYQRGKEHRFRAALDFVDTRKTNELIYLEAQNVLELEHVFPNRVIRAPLEPGDTHLAGLVTSVYPGQINAALRQSQNWNLSLDYAWMECLGGRLELYSRWVFFQRYQRQVYATSPVVDELNHPDSTAQDLLKHRVNFGAGWSGPFHSFGLDGHYFHSRILPEVQWANQGGDRVAPNWQFDAYLQSDLRRWLPWQSNRYGLRGQLRVNNIFGAAYPKYANDPSGAGVQPYGDWRGRTYSFSLTATF